MEKQSLKRKRIRKGVKAKKSEAADESQTSVEEECKKSLFLCVQELVLLFSLDKDTYLCCLAVLLQLKAEVGQPSRVVAAAVVLAMSKLHQLRVPLCAELVMWGRGAFAFQRLIQAESWLLHHFHFALPMANNLPDKLQGHTRLVEGLIEEWLYA